MKKILVTGAAGFIGFHLAKTLVKQGHQVTLLDDLSRGQNDGELENLLGQHKNATFLKMDLADPSQVKNLQHHDEIYHLAAINGTENFYKIPDKVLRANILSTINLLDWVKAQKNIKVVYASSSEAYAGTINLMPELIPTKEDVPLCIDDVTNVRWSYGASKLLGECALFAYGKTSQFDFAIVRYHNVYGPRMGYGHVLPQFLKRIYRKEFPLKIYGYDQTRSFNFVSDAVNATIAVMNQKGNTGEIYHLGDQDQEIRIDDLAKKLLTVLNLPTDLELHEAPPGSVGRRCPDTHKIEKIGKFADVKIETGLKEMADWYFDYFKKHGVPEN